VVLAKAVRVNPHRKEVRSMSPKKQAHNTDKKKNDCGCGCIGITEKKAKRSSSADKKSKK
jgi:hypothetical protein